jgi:hypothetical protein
VRGCACGDRDGWSSPETGVAHVGCLAKQAKILVAEANKNNSVNDETYERWNERWMRWSTCSLCKQPYQGDVACALAWACWVVYCDSIEFYQERAVDEIATSLKANNQFLGARAAYGVLLAHHRVDPCHSVILLTLDNVRSCYAGLGWDEKLLDTEREMFQEASRF